VRNRVRPYYLYQCDLVHGAGHFRTTVSKGIEIMESLRGHTSGYAIPTYVVDAPGGGGKIPVGPQYMLSQAPGKVGLRNFEGFITTYNEPNDYTGHNTPARPERELPHGAAGQDGVAGLLQGRGDFIKPEGFDAVHQRLGHVQWEPFPDHVSIRVPARNGHLQPEVSPRNGTNGHNGHGGHREDQG